MSGRRWFIGRRRGRNSFVYEPDQPFPTIEEPPDLGNEIRSVLNRHSAENVSNTPDYVLASFLMDCLTAFEAAVVTRDGWYGLHPRPGMGYAADRTPTDIGTTEAQKDI